MLLRFSDVLVGIIAGAICSVIAAMIEGGIISLRFFSLGHIGGGVGGALLWIALFGAIVGGLVGFFVSALFGGKRGAPPPPRAR